MRLLFVLMLLMANPVWAAEDLAELEQQAQLAGAAFMCAQKSGLPGLDDNSTRHLGQKIMEPYKKHGLDAANAFAQNMPLGLAMAGSATPSSCTMILDKFIPVVEGLGVDTAYWKKVAAHYRGETSKSGLVPLETGVYKPKGQKDGPMIFLSAHSNGELMGNDPVPFDWLQEGSRLEMEYTGSENKKARTTAKITGATSFILKGIAYEKDKAIKVFEYSYAKPDFEGQMAIFDSGDENLEVKIQTISPKTAICEIQLEECARKSGKIICRQMGDEDPDIMLIIQQNGETAEVSGTFREDDFCGNGGAFMGKYEKVGL